jgi:hypothetical protein
MEKIKTEDSLLGFFRVSRDALYPFSHLFFPWGSDLRERRESATCLTQAKALKITWASGKIGKVLKVDSFPPSTGPRWQLLA